MSDGSAGRGGDGTNGGDVGGGGSSPPVSAPAERALDTSAALFAVMRATYWATGEELLQRLVSSLAATFRRRAVLAEWTTARESVPAGTLGLWTADGDGTFRYRTAPPLAARPRDDDAVVAELRRRMEAPEEWRTAPVRSPSGRPLGQLLLEAGATRGCAGGALLHAVLLFPLAARAGAELARLAPLPPAGVAAGTGTLLFLCAWCKNVRDARHDWQRVEDYIRTLTDAAFTHGVCPACASQAARR